MQVRLSDALTAVGLQPQEVQSLMQLRSQAVQLDSSSVRIDLAPYQHVSWLNDLEKVRLCVHLSSDDTSTLLPVMHNLIAVYMFALLLASSHLPFPPMSLV